MQFLKSNKIYAIVRITSSQDNILGISFAQPTISETNLEVIEWHFSKLDKSKIRISKEAIVEQVLSGLESVNNSLGKNYKLSKVYFSAYDGSHDQVYSVLLATLIRHYHKGNEFQEAKLLNE